MRDAGAPVEPAERIERGVERQAGDGAERARVGIGRATAVEVGHDVQAWREVRCHRHAELGDPRDDPPCMRRGRLVAVQAEEMIEQRAGGGLAALESQSPGTAPPR